MTFDQLLERIEKDRSAHVLRAPAIDEDLAAVEAAVQGPLPASFCAFLRRFGGGLFYQHHDVHGPRTIVIHDIELVPDLLSFRRKLEQDGVVRAGDGYVPFHSADGVVHAFRIVPGQEAAAMVYALGLDTTYPDYQSFLTAVVLPTAASPQE